LSSIDQKVHYEKIHDEYEKHYYDYWSMAYRERFIYDIMFRGLDLNGKRVAELASGSGHNSLAALKRFPQAELTGFDISARACASYRELLHSEAIEIDLTKPLPVNKKFDYVFISGGLHHCISDLDKTFENISDLLVPGGMLLFYEPNAEYIMEGVRKLWYKRDKYFEEDSEAALSHSKMLSVADGRFRVHEITYLGGIAYFIIYNSLILRIPPAIKNILSPPLFAIESMTNRLPSKYFFPAFIGQWKKND